MEEAPFELEAVLQGRLVGCVHRLLRHLHHQRRVAGDARGAVDRFLKQLHIDNKSSIHYCMYANVALLANLAGREDLRHEAGLQRRLRVDRVAGERHLHGERLADRLRQALRATGACRLSVLLNYY